MGTAVPLSIFPQSFFKSRRTDGAAGQKKTAPTNENCLSFIILRIEDYSSSSSQMAQSLSLVRAAPPSTVVLPSIGRLSASMLTT